jgi:hypothetical protein
MNAENIIITHLNAFGAYLAEISGFIIETTHDLLAVFIFLLGTDRNYPCLDMKCA